MKGGNPKLTGRMRNKSGGENTACKMITTPNRHKRGFLGNLQNGASESKKKKEKGAKKNQYYKAPWGLFKQHKDTI